MVFQNPNLINLLELWAPAGIKSQEIFQAFRIKRFVPLNKNSTVKIWLTLYIQVYIVICKSSSKVRESEEYHSTECVQDRDIDGMQTNRVDLDLMLGGSSWF